MLLQASFEVKSVLQESYENSLTGKIRNSIFWNTDFRKIDLIKNKKFIIQRILERGNKSEIDELIKLYSKSTIKQELKKINNSFNPNFSRNINKYIYNKI